jgi:hypothetical protein
VEVIKGIYDMKIKFKKIRNEKAFMKNHGIRGREII